MEVTNKMLSRMFLILCIFFFILFAYNRHTMNVIMGFFCQIWAVSLKTWDILREQGR